MKKIQGRTVFEIKVHLDDGKVLTCNSSCGPHALDGLEKDKQSSYEIILAKSHVCTIGEDGYGHTDGNNFDFYPSHRIKKVTLEL